MASPPRIKREEIPHLVKEEGQDEGIKTEVEDVEKLVDQTGSEAMVFKEGLKDDDMFDSEIVPSLDNANNTPVLSSTIYTAIGVMKNRKARPYAKTICNWIHRRFGHPVQTVLAELERLVEVGELVPVIYKGSTTFRIVNHNGKAKRKRRSLKLVETDQTGSETLDLDLSVLEGLKNKDAFDSEIVPSLDNTDNNPVHSPPIKNIPSLLSRTRKTESLGSGLGLVVSSYAESDSESGLKNSDSGNCAPVPALEIEEGPKNDDVFDTEIVQSLDNANNNPVHLPSIPASIQVPENTEKEGNEIVEQKLSAKPMPKLLKMAPELKEQIFQEVQSRPIKVRARIL